MKLGRVDALSDMNSRNPDQANVHMDTSMTTMIKAINLLLDWLVAQSNSSIVTSDSNVDQIEYDDEIISKNTN